VLQLLLVEQAMSGGGLSGQAQQEDGAEEERQPVVAQEASNRRRPASVVDEAYDDEVGQPREDAREVGQEDRAHPSVIAAPADASQTRRPGARLERQAGRGRFEIAV
jgi:hypothetical protein